MRAWLTMGFIVGLITTGTASWAQGDVPAKKLIAVGWDLPNAERFRTNFDAMEKTPLQGTGVRFAGPGNKPALWFSFSREPYDEQAVAQILQDLKAVQPKQLRDRFLLLNANPGDVDWFDDAGWKVIVDHWRIGARVAREGGLKGIMFDPEAYREPYRAFDWSAQSESAKHTFAEYYDKARQRGREVMAATGQEYPDATILAFFLLSINREAAERSDPMGALNGHAYGLLPAFVNGWLDAAPPTLTIVDGCEAAYRFNSRLEFLNAANLIRNKALRLVAPENRYKYRAQVQVGFGVYLDAYVNPPDNTWYINPGTQTPVQRLAENVASALEVADEYVWVYGEQASWWPVPHPTADKIRWPQKLPGIETALRVASDPVGYVVGLLEQPGERKNLVVNGDFSATAAAAVPGGPQPADWKQGTAPPNWSYWQSGASKGHPTWDSAVGHKAPGSGAVVGMKWGCLIQTIPVVPGERYAVAAWYLLQGQGSPSFPVRWQTAEGKWHAESLDVSLNVAKSEGEWKLMAGAAVVPEGAGKMVLLPSVNGQQSEKDVLWWDDVVAFRID
ncbi:MAG: hypothetical protein ACYC63_00300 [Armatimonadota bacterium]